MGLVLQCPSSSKVVPCSPPPLPDWRPYERGGSLCFSSTLSEPSPGARSPPRWRWENFAQCELTFEVHETVKVFQFEVIPV
ncbi:hypothetical protein Tco_0663264 [Tanacetum coccineum]|uniref:Uncharacterized protein n=1 Tax=Tanacetum coccineum TaxID=301880 RepID=A0ABQ5DPF6_9ASTR